MKLVRYGQPGREKPGLIDEDGRLRDLSGEMTPVEKTAHLYLAQQLEKGGP